MSDKYTMHGDQGSAGALISVASVVSPNPAVRRAKLYEVLFSNSMNPADDNLECLLQRCTDDGTATAVTSYPLDPDAPAGVMVCGDNHTVEPTYVAGSFLLDVWVNQRATMRWVAVPGGEFMIPATADNGIGLQTIEAGAAVVVDVEVDLYWEE